MSRLDVEEILRTRAGEELALNERYLNPQFGRVLRTIGFDRSWAGAEGAWLIDADGARYLDLLGGYGVFAVGRNNPRVRAQLEALLRARTANLPQMGVTLLAGVLAEELVRRTPRRLEHVILNQSGAEAVEAAIKLARAATGRPRIVHCSGAFHGLTTGALAVGGGAEFRDRFGPLLPGCVAVPFGDLDALRAELAREDVAAFLVEPVQGKGVRLPPDGYLAAAQEECRRHGTLFAVDEVQTGLGRTGRFLACEHWGLEPDLLMLAKALSGGYVPIGAVLMSRAVYEGVFDSLERAVVHGSTFGTNDLAAAAGIATLAELDDARLVERSAAMGSLLLERTRALKERFDVVADVRGLGLMWGIEFRAPARPAARRVFNAVEARQPGLFSQLVAVPLFTRHRVLTQVAGHHVNVVKAIPPLVIGEEEIELFAGALEDVIARAQRLPRAMTSLGLTMARRGLQARRPVAP